MNHSFTNLLTAITQALIESNVKIIYNYPGRPASLLLDEVKTKTDKIEIQDYLPNEFVATAKGFGSSVAGNERSLVVFKDVGTNVASDHFYCLNHTGINRGLVFFIADDPSAWASQNEEDSRGIYVNAGLPLFEPCDQYSAYYCTLLAYELSEKFRLPFFIRTTGAAVKEIYNPTKDDFKDLIIPKSNHINIPFDKLNKWVSCFETVERDKEILAEKQIDISKLFDQLNINIIKGQKDSNLGIIASGFPATQLENENLASDISLLKLISVFPLPEEIIINFIKNKKRILVIDQGEPLLEILIRDCASRHGLNIPILGKLNGYVRKVGEFRDDDLNISVNAFKANIKPQEFLPHKTIAQLLPYKDDDKFKLMLKCLQKAVKETGVRPHYCGDPGQSSKITKTKDVEEMLHMETTMGCSISYLSGGIESYKRSGKEVPFKGIAYIGDSDFFHSALPGICEAVAKNHPILMILIDNQGAVSTGKQAHLGMKINNGIQDLSIYSILKSIGIKNIFKVNVENTKELANKFVEGINSKDFFAIICSIY